MKYIDYYLEQPPTKVRRTLSIISEIFLNMAKESPFYQTGETYATVNKFIQSNTHSFCQEVQNWASTRPKNADTSPLVSEKTSWNDVSEDLKTIHPFISIQQEEICNYLGKASIQWVSIKKK